MPRAKKSTKRAGGGIAYDNSRKKYKVTYKGEYVGRYSTKAEAEEALYKFIHSPKYEPDTSTFDDVYECWYEMQLKDIVKKKGISKDEVEQSDSFKGYHAAYVAFGKLHKKRFCTLKLKEIESEMKKKNQPMQRKMKVLMKFLLEYSLREEIIDGSKYHELCAMKIDVAEKSEKHYPFSKEEVDKLWDNAEDDMYIQFFLMCIYCGCRCGEMVNVKKKDVNLADNCFWIQRGKNLSARRGVPIHKNTKIFFENWMDLNSSEYLITRLDGNPFRFASNYTDFLESYWIPKLKNIGIYEYTRENGDDAIHKPHDMRLTFSTKWAEQGLDQIKRKKIQGHKSGDVGIDVYTKPFMKTLLDEINKLS